MRLQKLDNQRLKVLKNKQQFQMFGIAVLSFLPSSIFI